MTRLGVLLVVLVIGVALVIEAVVAVEPVAPVAYRRGVKKGIRYTTLSKPERCTGKAEEGDIVDVFYHVMRKDGTRVLSMQEDIVILGAGKSLNGLITGIEYGVLGMCRGEKRLLKLDPSVAFGARGHSEGIPPNEPVKVEVILVSFNRKKKDRTPDEDDNMNLRKFQKKKA